MPGVVLLLLGSLACGEASRELHEDWVAILRSSSTETRLATDIGGADAAGGDGDTMVDPTRRAPSPVRSGPPAVAGGSADMIQGRARAAAGFVEVGEPAHVRDTATFHVGDTVGWVHSSPDVPAGSTGEVYGFDKDPRSGWTSVSFPGVKRVFDVNELYMANQHKFGFQTGDIVSRSRGSSGTPPPDDEGTIRGFTADRATVCFPGRPCLNFAPGAICKVRVPSKFGWSVGDRVGWVHSSADVPGGARGEVVSFTCAGVRVRFPRGTWLFEPRELYVRPTDPRMVNAAWVPLHNIVGSMQYAAKHGTRKTDTDTKTQHWATLVTETVKAGMRAGVGFLGTGSEMTGGVDLGTSRRTEMVHAYAADWSSSSEEEFRVTFDNGSGYLWQWMIRIEMMGGEVLTTKTRSFALTDGAWMKPQCLPGWATDAPRYQACYDNSSHI